MPNCSPLAEFKEDFDVPQPRNIRNPQKEYLLGSLLNVNTIVQLSSSICREVLCAKNWNIEKTDQKAIKTHLWFLINLYINFKPLGSIWRVIMHTTNRKIRKSD